MATVIDSTFPVFPLPPHWSMADLQEHLGGIPAERIRLFPTPGTATEEDLVLISRREDRHFELIDGILVEKAMGIFESLVAGCLLIELGLYLRTHDLGQVFPADGALRVLPGVVRAPDVSFVTWARIPQGVARRPLIPVLVPDLAVEVLSPSNTRGEMAQKLVTYFSAGVRLVWYIDPQRRSAQVFTGVELVTDLDEDGVLVGADVLPGFCLSLRELFARAERQAPPNSLG